MTTLKEIRKVLDSRRNEIRSEIKKLQQEDRTLGKLTKSHFSLRGLHSKRK